MTRGPLLGLTLALALSACSPGGRGALEPRDGPGLTLVSTHRLPKDTARLVGDEVTADVTGLWSDQGESVEIQYSAGQTTARIAMASSSTWKGQTVRSTAAWDRSVTDGGNAIGRPLSQADSLQLDPGERKTVQIEYGRLPGGDRPTIGDEVTIAIPMPGGARQAKFRVAGE